MRLVYIAPSIMKTLLDSKATQEAYSYRKMKLFFDI